MTTAIETRRATTAQAMEAVDEAMLDAVDLARAGLSPEPAILRAIATADAAVGPQAHHDGHDAIVRGMVSRMIAGERLWTIAPR